MMRSLTICLFALLPGLACAQQSAHSYGGINGSYGFVQDDNDAIATFHTAKGGAFVGYQLSEHSAAEVAYLFATKKMDNNHRGVHDMNIHVVDMGFLLHSTTLLPGVFIRPSLGVMMTEIKDNHGNALSVKKERSLLASFGIGYEHPVNEHVALRIMHTTYMAWRGMRMNDLTLGIKLAF